MSVRGLSARLKRLLRGRSDPATCTGGTTYLRFNGEPLPPAADRPRCPHCGGEHILEIEEMVRMPDGSDVPIRDYLAGREG